MDQILLDSHIEKEEAQEQKVHVGSELAIQHGNQDPVTPKRSHAQSCRCPTKFVLVNVGNNPETGRPESVYVNPVWPVWLRCGCGKRMRVPIFHPESEIRLVWNIFGFIFIVFEAFLIPVYIAFSYEATGWMFSFVSMVNSYFIIDVIFTFFTGFIDGGIPVLAIGRIAHRYS